MAPDARWAHELSRRDFLKRTAGAAVAIPAAAEILAACTKPGTTSSTGSLPYQIARPEKPVTLPMNGDPIPSDTPIEQGAELQILNWSQYMWKYVLSQFVESQQTNGITFTAPSTFQNMDEGVAKLQAGQKADVFFPTIDVMGKLVAADLLQPLNHDLIPALHGDNWKTFQNPYYDQGWRYSVPYTIYTTGIGYRRDHIPDDVIHGMDNPWEILWDPQYSGKVGAYPSYRDVMGIVLMKNGITDMNTSKASDLETVRKDLLALTEDVDVRISYSGAYAKLPKDVFWLMTAWSGDMVAGWGYAPPYTEQAYENIGYWFPADRKGPVDNDLIAIPKNAENPALGHAFINFWLEYQHAMDNFSWNGYQPPQNQADVGSLTTTEGLYSEISNWAAPAMYVSPWMPDAVVRQEDFDVGYRQGPLTPDVDDQWHAVWEEFVAGAKS
jgi:spermidine/putrescine transport system substrate-binding protein